MKLKKIDACKIKEASTELTGIRSNQLPCRESKREDIFDNCQQDDISMNRGINQFDRCCVRQRMTYEINGGKRVNIYWTHTSEM